MTDSEFQSQVVKLSRKMQNVLGTPNGAGIITEFGSLAMNLTGTTDLSAALSALTADPTKLSAFETVVAARAAAVPQRSAVDRSAIEPGAKYHESSSQ
jgi:hypothetical protein